MKHGFVSSIVILCLIFFKQLSIAQELDLRTFDYNKADSIALHFPKGKYKSYTDIVSPLILGLKTEQEKYRAIFRWIAENVSYSYSNRSDSPNKAIKEKKAVCAGYSSLLKEMCNSAGLECETISGWSKVDQDDIGQSTKKTTHAWNAIKLNGKWYLSDVTWATSKYDKKKKKFIKEFDTAYFLGTPKFFIEQHFPKDKKWQMLDTIVKKSWFVKSFVCYEDIDKYGVKIISPTKGRVNQNDKKEFALIMQVNNCNDTFAGINFFIDNNFEEFLNTNTSVTRGKSSDELLITVKCMFPENLKGMHDIDVYYAGHAVSGFRINLH